MASLRVRVLSGRGLVPSGREAVAAKKSKRKGGAKKEAGAEEAVFRGGVRVVSPYEPASVRAAAAAAAAAAEAATKSKKKSSKKGGDDDGEDPPTIVEGGNPEFAFEWQQQIEHAEQFADSVLSAPLRIVVLEALAPSDELAKYGVAELDLSPLVLEGVTEMTTTLKLAITGGRGTAEVDVIVDVGDTPLFSDEEHAESRIVTLDVRGVRDAPPEWLGQEGLFRLSVELPLGAPLEQPPPAVEGLVASTSAVDNEDESKDDALHHAETVRVITAEATSLEALSLHARAFLVGDSLKQLDDFACAIEPDGRLCVHVYGERSEEQDAKRKKEKKKKATAAKKKKKAGDDDDDGGEEEDKGPFRHEGVAQLNLRPLLRPGLTRLEGTRHAVCGLDAPLDNADDENVHDDDNEEDDDNEKKAGAKQPKKMSKKQQKEEEEALEAAKRAREESKKAFAASGTWLELDVHVSKPLRAKRPSALPSMTDTIRELTVRVGGFESQGAAAAIAKDQSALEVAEKEFRSSVVRVVDAITAHYRPLWESRVPSSGSSSDVTEIVQKVLRAMQRDGRYNVFKRRVRDAVVAQIKAKFHYPYVPPDTENTSPAQSPEPGVRRLRAAAVPSRPHSVGQGVVATTPVVTPAYVDEEEDERHQRLGKDDDDDGDKSATEHVPYFDPTAANRRFSYPSLPNLTLERADAVSPSKHMHDVELAQRPISIPALVNELYAELLSNIARVSEKRVFHGGGLAFVGSPTNVPTVKKSSLEKARKARLRQQRRAARECDLSEESNLADLRHKTIIAYLQSEAARTDHEADGAAQRHNHHHQHNSLISRDTRTRSHTKHELALAEAWYEYGAFLARLGEYDLAKQCFRNSVDVAEDHISSFMALCCIHMEKDEIDEAAEWKERIVDWCDRMDSHQLGDYTHYADALVPMAAAVVALFYFVAEEEELARDAGAKVGVSDLVDERTGLPCLYLGEYLLSELGLPGLVSLMCNFTMKPSAFTDDAAPNLRLDAERLVYARCFLAQGDPISAIQLLKRFLFARDEQRLKKALADTELADTSKRDLLDMELWATLGDAYFYLKDHQQARRAYEHCMLFTTTGPTLTLYVACRRLASTYTELGLHDRAFRLYTQMCQTPKTHDHTVGGPLYLSSFSTVYSVRLPSSEQSVYSWVGLACSALYAYIYGRDGDMDVTEWRTEDEKRKAGYDDDDDDGGGPDGGGGSMTRNEALAEAEAALAQASLLDSQHPDIWAANVLVNLLAEPARIEEAHVGLQQALALDCRNVRLLSECARWYDYHGGSSAVEAIGKRITAIEERRHAN